MKRFTGFIVTLLVIAVLAVVGDRAAAWYTEREVVSNIEKNGDVTNASIDIQGFPFLTQVLAKNLKDVTGAASSATIGGLEVDDLTVTAHGVTTSTPYTVDDGTAAGVVPLETIKQAIKDKSKMDVNLTSENGVLTLSTDTLGTTVSADVAPAVKSPSEIALNISAIRMGGATVSMKDLPDVIASKVQDLAISMDMPEGIGLTTVKVVDGGVQVSVSGKNVKLDDLVTS